MDVGSALRTLLLATILTLPLFILKQYVHGLEVLFWIVMWRHYWPQESLDQATTTQILLSKEDFLKNFSELCLQPDRKDDDEEKLAQLSEQESNLVVDTSAQNGQIEQDCSSCSSKTGVVLCCQHTFCKACLVERNNQGVCPTCQTLLWDRNRLPTGKMHRWSYKANLISALIILSMFTVKSFLCWSVLPSKSANLSSRLFCSLDFTIGPWGRFLTPLMLFLATTRVWSEWGMDAGLWCRLDLWPHDARVGPMIASQMFSQALRLSNDVAMTFDIMARDL